MSFETTAKNIVSDSIRSAICIDDQFVQPYARKTKKVNDEDTPKGLYESFRKGNCSLDIYTYKGLKEFKKTKDFLFKDRDLLILDWEVNNSASIRFEDTLAILRAAIQSNHLPFILIYTSAQDLDVIELHIRSFFNIKYESIVEREQKFFQLCEILNTNFFTNTEYDLPLNDAEEFFNKLKIEFKSYSLRFPSKENDKTIKTKIRELIGDGKIGGQLCSFLEEQAKSIYNSNTLFTIIEQIVFTQENSYPNTQAESLNYSKVKDEPHSLLIHNTWITILHKARGHKDEDSDVSPNMVYGRISKQISKRPGSIITLVALEMKNSFRENINTIGKEFLKIDELAFFHSQTNLEKKEFFDFLKVHWKNQISAFISNSDPLIFGSFDEYKTSNDISSQLDEWKRTRTENFYEELARINFLFSVHQSSRRSKDYLRFGDIFAVSKSKNAFVPEKYIINITAHCDCLRPGKIANNFFFVDGKVDILKNGLEKVDDENYLHSFLVENAKPLCISWTKKPYTINIPINLISPGKTIKVKINNKDYYLMYKYSLMEGFTQRIANAAFANAVRVGVDFAKIRNDQSCEI